MTLAPRVVVVYRRTEYAELLDRHGTRGQAAFFLANRDRDLVEVEARHAAHRDARRAVAAAIPPDWRRGEVERRDLDRFMFAADDIIVCVGQDGLVANVAKYVETQPVVGVNPEPGRNPGVLVRHRPRDIGGLLRQIEADSSGAARRGRDGTAADDVIRRLTMAEAVLDDGQRLVALNELYVGDSGHQTARYVLRAPGPDGQSTERQASSGLLVGTGTGSTGWCRSVWQERASGIGLPNPEARVLVWFVREAWPSPATGTSRTEGMINGSARLELLAESERMVVFGDGIETDTLTLAWGQRISVGISERYLHLV
ncbi:hypothetical protein [Frankia sp. Cr1]|uniref:hypothetical protein n=1 Tax=Frankia sp. Cr1 TaxID=3073931 RepID=UPI002AD4B3B2|nr:hypothetical protein [Frankia sp. Cr1]